MPILHRFAAAVSLIAAFALIVLTAAAGLLDTQASTHAFRSIVLGALSVLAVSLALAWSSGTRLGGESERKITGRKGLRVKWVGVLAVLVLLPFGVLLDDPSIVQHTALSPLLLQAVELMAGSAAAALLILNAVDGKLIGRIHRQKSGSE